MRIRLGWLNALVLREALRRSVWVRKWKEGSAVGQKVIAQLYLKPRGQCIVICKRKVNGLTQDEHGGVLSQSRSGSLRIQGELDSHHTGGGAPLPAIVQKRRVEIIGTR